MKNKYFIKNKNKDLLEPEELFLDFMEKEENNMEIPLGGESINAVKKLFFLALLVLVFQTAYLQIVKGRYYAKISENNYKRIVAVKSPRGIIYDKNNKQIIFNAPIFDLIIMPHTFLKDKNNINDKIRKLSDITEISESDLRMKIDKADRFLYQSVLILANIEKDKALILEEKIKKIDGVELEKNAIRNYIDSKYFSNIIGYSGRINEVELENYQEYQLTDMIGKDGLELFYEEQLRGKYGKQEIEVDSFGKTIRVIKKENSESGNSLILNIDSGLQKKIYNELDKIITKLKTEAGASVVALNPKNGAVLALVNFPSYDNNLFAKGINNDDYNKLLADKTNPLLNKTIAGEYPPGSTFKPLVGVAALQEKIIDPKRKIVGGGAIYVGSYIFPDWKVHGMIDLTGALAQSCNVYFYTVGGGYGGIEGLGIDRIKKYADLFGLGNSLGIDLPGEKTGLVPDQQWKQDKKDEKWYIGDTYHVSIGQGDILVTPLQIASYTAVIANGGKLFQPQVVDKIIDSDGNIIKDISPKIIRENFVDLENLKWVQKGMRENVTSGSGIALYDLQIEVAGKTGTAQYYGNQKTHAWYIAYAPYDNPEIVMAIIVEGGGEGYAAAVPVVKEALKWYFEDRNFQNDI
ncbi:MAG: penicillin-binding protein 2 [Candidatus Pacebacteria bacterium]|nr:penicillin-binding protein 2 [Candidatus Paceibacterota bacterium]